MHDASARSWSGVASGNGVEEKSMPSSASPKAVGQQSQGLIMRVSAETEDELFEHCIADESTADITD